MLSFPQALKICIIKKPFNWKDRASRSEFWWFFLFINLFAANTLGTQTMLSFPQALKICIIKKPFNWKDRASRSEFWWFFLFINLFSIFISPLAEQYKVMNIIMGVSSIPLLWLHTMVSIRRLHDLNKSAWWLFAPYLPLAEQYKVMNIIMGVSSIPLLWLHTMVSIRRLHDLNKSAWWLFAPYLYLLLAIIILALTVDPWADEKSPVHIVLILGVFAVLIYFLVLLCLFCKRGTVGANRFGPDPLELDLLSTHNQFAQYNQSQQHIKPTKRDSSQVEKGLPKPAGL